MKKKKSKQQFCACSCGAPTTYRKGKYSTYLHGHGTRKKRELVFCACGCGLKRITIPTSTSRYQPRYIAGHHLKGKPSANRGRKLSKEWRHNMSLALIRSWKNRKKKL